MDAASERRCGVVCNPIKVSDELPRGDNSARQGYRLGRPDLAGDHHRAPSPTITANWCRRTWTA